MVTMTKEQERAILSAAKAHAQAEEKLRTCYKNRKTLSKMDKAKDKAKFEEIRRNKWVTYRALKCAVLAINGLTP
tara:strand:+ start:880 stop:1104 length:225 start_codon:yes stop_codon:yes gene_type:complete